MLKQIIEACGLPLKDLTVLSPSRDPYRLDTPANHKLGEWLSNAYGEVNPGRTITHLRGLHYMLVGCVNKPDGALYTNTDENWLWLSEKAAKAARWLGYLDWDLIRDARNSPPQVFTPQFNPPEWRIAVADVELYLPDDLAPRFRIIGDTYRQPYRQAVIAEKQGVENLLKPICQHFQASLILPSGEISDSLVYDIMKAAHQDGRPLIIHQLGDFDPAGNQMAVSTARKAQAMHDRLFPDIHVIVNPIGLTLEQCREWQLPSTPLKETERRADKWHAVMGWEQTELDAAVALQPNAFVNMVSGALGEYYDDNLNEDAGVRDYWLEQDANASLARELDDNRLAVMREQVQERMLELQEQVAAINRALYIDTDEITPPPDIDVMEGKCSESLPPMLDTREPWLDSTRRMIQRKALGE